jgi:GR25 family glycosyltransferase involved in LPS biosynthesis
MAPSVQIIVITGNAARKALLMKQFEELNIPFPVYYLPASTPENTASYFPETETDIKNKRVMCCAKSHIRAIEHAAYETATDFSIIMEDDASLHKSLFVPTVIELVTQWDRLIERDSLMVSLGWVPFKNYSHYAKDSVTDAISCLPGSKLLPLFAYGTQSYILKKSTALTFYPILKKDTWEDLKRTILELNHPQMQKDNIIMAVDCWMNRLLVQTILFPQIVIEQPLASTIDPGAETWHSKLWMDFFKGYEHEHRNYWVHSI